MKLNKKKPIISSSSSKISFSISKSSAVSIKAINTPWSAMISSRAGKVMEWHSGVSW